MRHDMCKGGSTSGRTGAGIPKIPSPGPKSQEKLVFLDNQKMKPPKFRGSKSCGNKVAD